MSKLKAQGEPVATRDDYVAWMRYKSFDSGRTTIHICDSDTTGAFRVYRAPPADDRPTWTEVRQIAAAAFDALIADDVTFDPPNITTAAWIAADRIIAEFRKEKGK